MNQYRSSSRAETIMVALPSAGIDITSTAPRGCGALSVQVLYSWWGARYVHDVDGRVKATGLRSRRSSLLSEDAAFELPLLLTRVPLVFLCCRHCAARDEDGDGDGGRLGSVRVVDEELWNEPAPVERTTRAERRCSSWFVGLIWRRGQEWRGVERLERQRQSGR
jgi:hypothetical protein